MPLPNRFLVRLRRLPIRLRKVLSGGTEGLHPSKIKGSGLTFVENRPYEPGDDPRAINWPLTARLGAPVIKRFEASRELILWLVVDPSPSMFLGDPVTPMRWVIEIAGAAMATLNAGNDKLGLLVPGDGRIPALRLAPKRGRVAGLKVLEMLCDRGPAIPTPESWRETIGHWGQHGKGHRFWILSNGAGLRGLAPLVKPLSVRNRIVWFRPENHYVKNAPRWPDPGFSPHIERQVWNLDDDPVLKLAAWLRGGGA